MAKKGNHTKYPLFGKLRRLHNLKLKESDLPTELQNKITFWNSRKPVPYSYNEEAKKTDFGQECLRIANELADWLDVYVHERAENESLKLADTPDLDNRDFDSKPNYKAVQKPESEDLKENKVQGVELTASREPQKKVESPQILVTANATKEEENENNETTRKKTITRQQTKGFIDKSVQKSIISDKKTEISPPPKEKSPQKEVVHHPLKTAPKKSLVLNEIEQKLAQLYTQGVLRLKMSDLKKYKISLRMWESYHGTEYSLIFDFWSWNYPYTLIKK